MYLGRPPELWERAGAAYRAWWARHPGLAHGLGRLVWVCYLVAIPLLLLALLVIPRLAIAMVPGLFAAMGLVIMTGLARTRTVSWRAVGTMYGVGIWCAFAVAVATGWVGELGGLSPQDDGASIALAAFVEEPGKLIPLAVMALVAPGRVRRLAATDWALLGYAAGLGFTVAEDSVRRLREPGLLEALLGESRFSFSPNPWTLGSYADWDGAMAVGHQVHTMIVTMAVGLGIALWRAGSVRAGASLRPARRVAAVVLPVLALAQVTADHAGWNAHEDAPGWMDGDAEGLPWWVRLLWTVGGQGNLAIPVSVVLLGCCLLVDAYRRGGARERGLTLPGAPAVRLPVLAGVPGPLQAALIAVMALAQFTWSDLVVVWSAYGDRRRGVIAAMWQGRATAVQVRGVRADAMGAVTPGREPGARRRFRLVALAVTAAGLLWVVYGLWIAESIGGLLGVENDSVFFAGLLEGLWQWWDGLGWPGQVFMIAMGVFFIMAFGGSFALAMGATGVAAWGLSHGRGLAALLRDPRGAFMGYVTTVTPGQLCLDTLDFLLTFVPGGALGRATHWALGAPAAALAEARAIRASADFVEQQINFAAHAQVEAATRAAETRLEQLASRYGYTTSDFTLERVEDTLDDLRISGVSKRELDELKDLAKTVSDGRGSVRRLAEYAGERGGEQVLNREGYRIPETFHSVPPPAPGAGKGRLDGLAVSPRGDEVVIPEYKGGTAAYNPRRTYALDELGAPPAAQGTPDYVMDRMLQDKRVPQYFHDNPGLWESVKDGRTSMRTDVFETPGPGRTSRVRTTGFSPSPSFIAKMEQKIAGL